MGASVGSLIALEHSPAHRMAEFKRVFATRPMSDFNWLPLLSIIGGRRLNRHLDQGYRAPSGERLHIEDAWKSYFCVASSYSYAREALIRRGPMVTMVRASLSVPGFLPPVFHKGEALMDGAIFNNFPTGTLRSEAGFLIGVSLKLDNFGPVPQLEMPSSLAVWRHARRSRQAGRDVPRIPSLKSMLFHVPTLYSASRHDESARLTDLLIQPDLSSVGMLDWSALERAADLGYEHAQRALARGDAPWRDTLQRKMTGVNERKPPAPARRYTTTVTLANSLVPA